MYIRCCLLTISWLARASSYTDSSRNLLLDQQTKSCPSDGIPVCGLGDNQFVLFSNACLLNQANKDTLQSGTSFREVSLQHCMNGCKFSCQKLDKPVCARNTITYQNRMFTNHCELMKYICKTNMDFLKISPYECPPRTYSQNINKLLEKRTSRNQRRPVPCTNVFKPVCGSYMGVKSSFKNECLLNTENVAFNRDWHIVNYGMCPEDYSKDRRRKDKPTYPHSIQKRSFNKNLYNQYSKELDYNALNFLDNKYVSSNDLYVYVPPTFHTSFSKHDAFTYQNLLPEQKAYDEIVNKIVTFSPALLPYPAEQNNIKIEETISPLPFAINSMNTNYLYDQNLAYDINSQSFPQAMKSLNVENKNQYNEIGKFNNNKENEKHQDIPSTTHSSAETMQIPSTTNSPKVISQQQQLKQLEKEEVTGKNVECKSGSIAICAKLNDGTVQTFETICEMMTANVYFKSAWTKLHDGACDDCHYNCSQDYKPICISRNGVNYTMVNECYYNMGICKDKKSVWQKLSNNKCERYTRTPKKTHSSTKSTKNSLFYKTAQPSTDSLPEVIASKAMKVKSSKCKKRRPNIKRAVGEQLSSLKCCPQLHNRKCKSWSDTETTTTSTVLEQSSAESQTESYIMRLVKEKDK